jgi:outer membrane autotransporter protein
MTWKIPVLLTTITAAALSQQAQATGTVFIYDGDYSDVATNLAARQTAAGNTPTVVSWSGGTIAALPSSLAGYSQVWDVNGHLALTTDQQTSYLAYLQTGGSLFLMGENTGYGALRNASLVSFIATAGGGTVSITSNTGSAETVSSSLQSPNTISTISYAASGSYATAGTGTCLTTNTSNTCSAIAFSVGTLANAKNGSLISVLDINFLESSRASSFQSFIDNLVAYMAAQSQAGQAAAAGGSSSGFVPKSNSISNGAATVLDQLTSASSIDVNMAADIGKISAMPASDQSAALERLTPQTSRAATVASQQVINGSLDSVASRLDSLREPGASTSLLDDLYNGKLRIASDDLTSVLSGRGEASRNHMWIKAFGARNSQDASGDYAGYHALTSGLAIGADTKLDNQWVLGGAVSYASTQIKMKDVRDGDRTSINSYQITGYGSRDFGRYYIDGMIAYAQHKYNTSRDTTVDGTADGRYDGSEYAARISTGIPFTLGGKYRLTPLAGFDASHTSVEDYSETGAGPLSLSVQSKAITSLRSTLGAKISSEYELGQGITAKPSVTLAWHHEFSTDTADSTSNFNGGGASFETPGQSLIKNTYSLSLGSSFETNNRFSLKVLVNAEKGTGYTALAGQVQGLWRF